MRAWKELKKECAVCGQVASNAYTPQCGEDADGCKIRTTGCNHTKQSSNADSEIECPPSAPDVAAEAPEQGAKEKTDVLSKREVLWR